MTQKEWFKSWVFMLKSLCLFKFIEFFHLKYRAGHLSFAGTAPQLAVRWIPNRDPTTESGTAMARALEGDAHIIQHVLTEWYPQDS